MRVRGKAWVGILLAVCLAGLGLPSRSAAGPAGEVRRGGILRLGDELPEGLFGIPWRRAPRSTVPAVPVFETPLWVDVRGRAHPHLVERWSVGPDRRSVSLVLRRNIRFHDGTLLNARALQWNLQKQIEIRRAPDIVKAVEVRGPFEVVIHLERWANGLLLWVGGLGATDVVSPDYVLRVGEDQADERPVGTGPFRVTRYDPKAFAEYVRFDGYWDRGKPYLDRLELRFFAEMQTMKAALLAGQLDVAGFNDPAVIAELRRNRELREISGLHTLNWALWPDSENADSPLRDRRVREAVSLAVDRNALAAGVGHGVFRPWGQIAHPGHMAALEGNPLVRFDPERARRLLAEAGYGNGFRTRIISEAVSRDIAVAVQGFLGGIGIETEIEIVDRARMADYQRRGWRGFILHPMPYVPNFNSWLEFFFIRHPLGQVSLRRPERLREMWEVSRATIQEDRNATRQIHRYLLEELMVIPLLTGPQKVYFAWPYVRGTHLLEGATWPRWKPGDAWIAR
ncbi:MAG: ABC transporter substrate-binding protein [Armatimonadota bacterium]|nr:ABC transporter substrate-binding protein [Armatimonadota bacterium]MDR7444730.1 ABC transporter substrate-binding protein [Armatimonadota bacterium]MDR7570887.1 ABC transporter substrate-binding protein [Armatimonadota bacterium]MDR7613265.1 ABC transporter substrate-binding protein [Armatimonadota bacterium]